MLSKLSKLLIFLSLSVYVFYFLFFWLYETTDSYFYWAFAEFLKTGIYSTPYPYNWTIPSTLGPPLYSLFLYLAQFIPRADIIIHFFQLLSVLLSAYFLFRILISFIRRTTALIITTLYLLIPAHFFEASTVMTESFALLAFSTYLYFAFQVIAQGKNHFMKYWLLFSAIIVLIRYNFVSLFFLALIIILFEIFKKVTSCRIVWVNIIFILISFTVIALWVLINHNLNGSWGLSDQMGKNLYNRAIGGDKLIPPSDDPSWLKLKAMTNDKIDLFKPTYDIEPFILSNFDGSVARESQFFASLAISSIKAHPLEYFRNTLVNFFVIHKNGLPYAHDLYTDSWWMGKNCRSLGNITFCKAPIDSKWAESIWNFAVKWAQTYYYNIPVYINFLLLFPSLIVALLQKNKFIRFAAVTYIIAVFTVVIPEVPVYRYLYPLYPLKVILVIFFIKQIYSKCKQNAWFPLLR